MEDSTTLCLFTFGYDSVIPATYEEMGILFPVLGVLGIIAAIIYRALIFSTIS